MYLVAIFLGKKTHQQTQLLFVFRRPMWRGPLGTYLRARNGCYFPRNFLLLLRVKNRAESYAAERERKRDRHHVILSWRASCSGECQK